MSSDEITQVLDTILRANVFRVVDLIVSYSVDLTRLDREYTPGWGPSPSERGVLQCVGSLVFQMEVAELLHSSTNGYKDDFWKKIDSELEKCTNRCLSQEEMSELIKTVSSTAGAVMFTKPGLHGLATDYRSSQS